MASTDRGLYVYLGVLWIAFFGMVAFRFSNPITKRAKILGAVTFVLLLIDASGLLRGVEV